MDRLLARVAIAVILAAAALFVFHDLLPGRLPLATAGVRAALDDAERWAAAIGSGEAPLWDPSPPPGSPLLGVPGAQAFHPPRLLHLVLGPTAGLVVLFVGQLALLGAGVYALARALGRSRGAALLAALGAELSPLAATATGSPALLASLCLAPWPVVFALRTARELRVRDAAAAGLLAGLVFLAGSVEIGLVAAAATALAFVASVPAAGPRVLALAPIAAVVAATVTGVLWAPFLDLAAAPGVLPASVAAGTPGIADLTRLALPFHGAEPPRLTGAGDPWAAEHVLRSVYLGAPLLLLSVARPSSGDGRRLAAAVFVLAGLGLAPAAAFATAAVVPGLGVLDPVAFAAPSLLAVPLLAAFGADALAVERRGPAVRRQAGGGRLLLTAAISVLSAVAVALTLFASGAGLLLSASIAWALAAGVLAILVARSFAGVQAAALPLALAVLVTVDLGGVHLLDPPVAASAAPAPEAAGVPSADGRARVVPAFQVTSRAEAATRAAAADFDPGRTVLLDGTPEAPPAGGGPGSATVVRDDPREVHVIALAPAGGWLLLADRWAPGWNAAVNGAPTELLRANGRFRAVPLPPGEHQVDFRYRPRAWPVGLAVTALGVAVTALCFATTGRRRRRDPGTVRL